MPPRWRDPDTLTPRLIIHGGAGSITRANLTPAAWAAHRTALLRILHSTHALLTSGKADALAAATHAVQLLEDDALFNAGRGAVFTRAGTTELEASVMVSRGHRKAGAGVSLLKHVRSPVTLAAEMLRRGDAADGGGAQRHEQLSGRTAEALADRWGLEMCEESYFWTKKRWQEHRRGLKRDDEHSAVSGEGWKDEEGKREDVDESTRPDGGAWPASEPGWDGLAYLPQGTVGCAVLDASGTLAVATSTGGLTNKLPGRLGDTPTFGAGFWAEEWVRPFPWAEETESLFGLRAWPLLHSLSACLPSLLPLNDNDDNDDDEEDLDFPHNRIHGVAMSGTGNGDSFLRICAVRTAAARARFGRTSLGRAVSWMAGPGGELQRSAGEWWRRGAFEGEGGIIGVERLGGRTGVVADFNCGGMFRAWVDDGGEARCMVFHDEY